MDRQHVPVIFGEWLQRRRKSLDMTQDELAQRAGCSVSAVRKIESGERKPSKQLAGPLAKALKIPPEDQQIFIRVARGELNIERLRQSLLEPVASSSDASALRLARRGSPLNETSGPDLATHRIPVQTTPLIGRDSELAAMEKLFDESQCRLLTLTGTGGIGKTRLAVEFALRQLPAFPGGVYYAPLAAVNSTEAIVPAIADALEFGFSGPADPREQLIHYMAHSIKHGMLLVLDNLEHLLVEPQATEGESGPGQLVSEMLRRLPNLRILGTSRERLSLRGEWTYELHGLPVPPANYAGRLEQYNAVVLFTKCAQRARADFAVTSEEQPAVAQICQLTEGNPLAIELAAAWAGILSCREIAQEIKSNMDFLTTSMRDVPKRHRSIRATFDHSWDLLSPEERQALCKLSVFRGGFDRSAAMEIAGASLPLLAALSTKSLVRRTESGRFDLHDVIRQYAAYHLNDDSQNPETYGRHGTYFLAFVGDREKSLKNALQQEAFRELTDEIDNIRTAWAWALDHKDFAQLGRAARGFGWYFEIAGLYSEGIEQLEPLVQALKNRSHEVKWHRLLGLTLVQQALLYFRKGEFGHARNLYEESIILLRPVGDPALLADPLIFLAIILHLTGDYEQAERLLDEGLTCARAGDDPWFEAYAIYNLGYIASLKGHTSQGYEQMVAGVDMWRALGDPHYIALGLNFLVPTLNKLGRSEEAIRFMQESIALCEQSKNYWGMGTAYRYLGLATMAGGHYVEAQTHLCKSLEIFGGQIIGWDIARSLAYLGDATMMSGDLAEARKNYLDALRLSIEAGAIPIALDALSGLGNLQAQAGKAEYALVLCYHISSHPSSEADTRNRAEVLREALETRLDPERIKAARTMARQRTFDLIVNEALEAA